MSGEVRVTMVGNLVSDPDLRFTQSGTAVANLRLACTPRVFNRDAGEWRDGETLFMTCTAWRALAENVAASVGKGARVTVSGVLGQRSYDDRDGVKRTVVELDADDVSVSLSFARADVHRITDRTEGRRVASVPDAPAVAV